MTANPDMRDLVALRAERPVVEIIDTKTLRLEQSLRAVMRETQADLAEIDAGIDRMLELIGAKPLPQEEAT